MDLNGSHTYEAPVEAVLAMLRDPAATVAKYESMGHHDIEVLECKQSGGAITIRTKRVVDVDLPGFAKRVLKPTNTMTQTDQWQRQKDGCWEGRFDVDVHGAPIHISGTMRLSSEGSGARHDVTIEVTANVPIIGGRLADWAGKNDVRRSLQGEFDFNDHWLAEHSAA